MKNPSIEQLTDPAFVSDLPSLSLDEVRTRRTQCQDAEEALSLQRRLVQGRLDIVQSELYRRSGSGSESDTQGLIESLPKILADHGDRHLGPGRLTSVTSEDEAQLGHGFDELVNHLDKIVDGARLSKLADENEQAVRAMADELDQLEQSISKKRHELHRRIDQFQAEVVRRYKSGEASVEGLLPDV